MTYLVFFESADGGESVQVFDELSDLVDYCSALEEDGVNYSIFELGQRLESIDSILSKTNLQ